VGALAREIAAIRLAVRRSLLTVRDVGRCLAACSGGPDSLALAAAAGFVAPRLGLRCGLVTVDHRLQAGSAERAADVSRWAAGEGFDPVVVCEVDVSGRPGGPEAAARAARYEALCAAAREHGAGAVLLGHTKDDQAETVLLALARGGGPRGLAGMPARREIDGVTFLRPLLGVRRADTVTACGLLGLKPWDDPHNSDPAFARARLRTALPHLARTLGDGIVDNLARVAALTAADTAALDALAERAAQDARDGAALRVDVLAAQPAAIRTRVLRRFAADAGAAALSQRHLVALDALVTEWHGQGAVALPGGLRVVRRGGRLAIGV
jgi:tRNA(Ile)-lysidine synthase